MKNWHKHYETTTKQINATDFLKQVAKTVGGKPITETQLTAIIESISINLDLRTPDILLDLCCGNGIVTKSLASQCENAIGIDFSESLLSIAEQHNKLPNLKYINGSILDLATVLSKVDRKFSRVLMYEALQCFEESELPRILEELGKHIALESRVFIGSIPDKERIWDFYNTPARRKEYFTRMEEGTEAIGTWWEREAIDGVARQAGFTTTFLSQPPILHTAHYRFDVLLKPS